MVCKLTIHSWCNFYRTVFTWVRQLAGPVYLRNLWHSVGVKSAAVAFGFHVLYSVFIKIIKSCTIHCSEGKSWANTFNHVASLELPSRLFSLVCSRKYTVPQPLGRFSSVTLTHNIAYKIRYVIGSFCLCVANCYLWFRHVVKEHVTYCWVGLQVFLLVLQLIGVLYRPRLSITRVFQAQAYLFHPFASWCPHCSLCLLLCGSWRSRKMWWIMRGSRTLCLRWLRQSLDWSTANREPSSFWV